MKKIICVITALMCLCMSVNFAYASEETVSISFRVGDSVLSINGVDTTVETPYVVGDGVTLVPLRVITEAFGAKVDWIADTKTITLEYPDVNIIIQIGNKVAEVNGKAETLLAAPELTSSGFTMVPLRFISENFGADVSYDEATAAILVEKKVSAGSSTVVGTIDSNYIGDSYYGWTMENPKDMVMEDRSFDGLYTCFSYGEKNAVFITYEVISDEYDFEREFNNNKTSLKDYTLVKADKNSDGEIKSAHFQAKNKEEFFNLIYFVKGDCLVQLVGVFDNTDTVTRDEFVRIMSTFKFGFDASVAYDLSNAKDGWRTFEDEFTGYVLVIPDNYYQRNSEAQNEFEFMSFEADDNISRISAAMYSKSEVESAYALGKKDMESNKRLSNEKITSYTDLVSMKYNGIEVYEYTETVSESLNHDYVRKDVFFENGNYVYNVSVTVKAPDDKTEIIMSKLLGNLKVNDVNEDEVGVLIRNDTDIDSKFTAKTDDWSMVLPNSYVEIGASSERAVYVDEVTGTMISVVYADAGNVTKANVGLFLKELIAESVKEKGVYSEKSVENKKIGNNYYAVGVTRIDKDLRTYVRHYAAYDSKKVFMISASIPESTYSQSNIETVEEIVGSFSLIK